MRHTIPAESLSTVQKATIARLQRENRALRILVEQEYGECSEEDFQAWINQILEEAQDSAMPVRAD